MHREGHGFGKYTESLINTQNKNLTINISFVPGGINQSGTLSPANAGTIKIDDDLSDLITDLDFADLELDILENANIDLTLNSGINFEIINSGDASGNALGTPITINNYAGLDIGNVELESITALTNAGTLTLNENCELQTATGGSVTNTGTIDILGNGTLNIGQEKKNTATLENNSKISVSNGGTLNCYGILTNDNNAELNIASDGNVTMLEGSTLENNGTITVSPAS